MTGSAKTRGITPLIAAATLAACATSPPAVSPPAGAPSAAAQAVSADDLLASAVYSQLIADPVYYFRHVDVRVDGGVAYLSGYVWSTDALYRARKLARSVPGVSGVVTTQLELERNGRSDGVAR